VAVLSLVLVAAGAAADSWAPVALRGYGKLAVTSSPPPPACRTPYCGYLRERGQGEAAAG